LVVGGLVGNMTLSVPPTPVRPPDLPTMALSLSLLPVPPGPKLPANWIVPDGVTIAAGIGPTG